MSTEIKKESPYQILSKWLNDKSKISPMPKELEEDKAIGSQYILYYFQTSPYILYLNELFNNFDIYQMKKKDVFKMMKDICLKISFRPKYIANTKEKNTALEKCLQEKYPYLKQWEIGYLGSIIDSMDNKDNIYESFGLLKLRKQKSTIKDSKPKVVPVLDVGIKAESETWSLDKLTSQFN